MLLSWPRAPINHTVEANRSMQHSVALTPNRNADYKESQKMEGYVPETLRLKPRRLTMHYEYKSEADGHSYMVWDFSPSAIEACSGLAEGETNSYDNFCKGPPL